MCERMTNYSNNFYHNKSSEDALDLKVSNQIFFLDLEESRDDITVNFHINRFFFLEILSKKPISC